MRSITTRSNDCWVVNDISSIHSLNMNCINMKTHSLTQGCMLLFQLENGILSYIGLTLQISEQLIDEHKAQKSQAQRSKERGQFPFPSHFPHHVVCTHLLSVPLWLGTSQLSNSAKRPSAFRATQSPRNSHNAYTRPTSQGTDYTSLWPLSATKLSPQSTLASRVIFHYYQIVLILS